MTSNFYKNKNIFITGGTGFLVGDDNFLILNKILINTFIILGNRIDRKTVENMSGYFENLFADAPEERQID